MGAPRGRSGVRLHGSMLNTPDLKQENSSRQQQALSGLFLAGLVSVWDPMAFSGGMKRQEVRPLCSISFSYSSFILGKYWMRVSILINNYLRHMRLINMSMDWSLSHPGGRVDESCPPTLSHSLPGFHQFNDLEESNSSTHPFLLRSAMPWWIFRGFLRVTFLSLNSPHWHLQSTTSAFGRNIDSKSASRRSTFSVVFLVGVAYLFFLFQSSSQSSSPSSSSAKISTLPFANPHSLGLGSCKQGSSS